MEPLLHSLGLLRSLLFTIPLCFLWTVLMGAVSLAVSPFDVRGRRQHLVARRWARGILLICGVRVRVRGVEPVDAGRRRLQAVNYIREGLSVVVFPEGGRSVSGALEEFRTGVFLAAVKVGAPIVPITIRGSRRVLSPRSWPLCPGAPA